MTSVYARRGQNRIYYRAVDEYGGDTLAEKRARSSRQPLTLRELVDFFLGAWDLFGCLDANFAWEGYPVRDIHRFLLTLESDFYPDFEEEVRDRVYDWLATKPVRETEEEEED